MKKWVVLVMAITSTAGCVTSPITTTNFNPGVAPVHPVPAAVTGLVPGFTQLLNREWVEAAIYFAGGVLPAAIAYAVSGPPDAILYFREYTEYDPVWRYLPVHSEAWRTVVYYTGLGISGAFWGTSFVDGIMTSAVRHKQWRAIMDPIRAQRERDAEAAARERYRNIRRALLGKDRLRIGMSTAQVIETIGRPDDINTSVGSWGTREQWIYDGARQIGDEVHLYIEDGKLKSWQY